MAKLQSDRAKEGIAGRGKSSIYNFLAGAKHRRDAEEHRGRSSIKGCSPEFLPCANERTKTTTTAFYTRFDVWRPARRAVTHQRSSGHYDVKHISIQYM